MVNEGDAENYIDRFIGEPRIVSGSDLQPRLQTCTLQALPRQSNQVWRNVHTDDSSSALDKGNNVFPRPTAKVQHCLAPDITKQVKSVFECKGRVTRRIQVAINLRAINSRNTIFRASSALRSISARSRSDN